jgi:hypothetical protein
MSAKGCWRAHGASPAKWRFRLRLGEGVDDLLKAIDAALHSDPLVDAELRVPQLEGGVLAAIEAGMVVHSREYEAIQCCCCRSAALLR